MSYEAVIGLEVHAQLMTQSKIFCSCPAAYGAASNLHCCPVCLGLPGALPVINERAVDYAMRMILAVGGDVSKESVFARKNYFYPDLPKGYQISQYDRPLGEHGRVSVTVDGSDRNIRIRRIHLEDDAGKSFHPEGERAEPVTTLDLNRCGVPLIEIVTEPDIRSPQEAAAFLARFRQLVQYLQICTGNMEEGALRCDANISVRQTGTVEFGTRTEIKNLNSIRSVERALQFEYDRQIELLKSGQEVVQETLLWDEKSQTSHPMRSKEESSDYRYFPEPDLLTLTIDGAWLRGVRCEMPELPEAKEHRFVQKFEITPYDAQVLTATRSLADYFEAVVDSGVNSKLAANWIQTEVLRAIKDQGTDIEGFVLMPKALAELLLLMDDGKISGSSAKKVFEIMLASGRRAAEIVESEGLSQISNEAVILDIIEAAMTANTKQLEQYRRGKTKLYGFFVGQVMKKLQGRGNPEVVNRLLRKKLDEQ